MKFSSPIVIIRVPLTFSIVLKETEYQIYLWNSVQKTQLGDHKSIKSFKSFFFINRNKVNNQYMNNANLTPIDCRYEEFQKIPCTNSEFYSQDLDQTNNKQSTTMEIFLRFFQKRCEVLEYK